MDIKKIFNIILLALSLSTIFITLISYIIFKLRQAVSANIDHDEDQLDGTYFRKYNPELEKINEEKKQESDALAKNPKKAIFKFVGMAVFVFLCIFTVFMLEDYFKYREQVKNKMMSAHDFKQLIAEGLLAKHDYNPYHGPVKISEKLSNNAKAQMKQFVTSFKNQNFCVASNTRTQQLNFNDHNKAKKAWLEFFARHSLKATVHENIKNIPDCFWIFPHIKSLSRKEWAIVSPILKQKRSIITGSFYALNGIGKKNKNNPFYEIFPSRPQAEKKISATLVHAESDSFWDIPAGRLLNWHPINKNWSFIESKKITSLVAGKFEGRIFKNKNNDYAAYKSRFQKAKGIMWLALDPMVKDGLEQKYVDLITLGQIYELNNRPISKIANIRNGKENPIALVITVDNTKTPLKSLLEELNDMNLPYTLAVHSSNLKSLKNTAEMTFLKDVALVNSISDKTETFSAKESFDYIQTQRFLAEELSRIKVTGYIPTNEKLSPKILTAVDLNELSYVYGGRKINSYGPVFLEKGQIMYLPRSSKNSVEINNDPILANDDDMYYLLNRNYYEASELSAPYTLSISNSSFKDPIFKKALLRFLKEKKEKIKSLGDIMSWYQHKDKIKTSTKFHLGKWRILLENGADRPSGNFRLFVRYNNQTKNTTIPSIKSGESFEYVL